MYVVEIDYPGNKLSYKHDNVGRLKEILEHMQFTINEATVALNYFEFEFSNCKKAYEAEIYDGVLSAKIEQLKKDKKDMELDEIEIIAKRQLWADGNIPKDYLGTLVYIYAKNFLCNMNNIYKLVSMIKDNFNDLIPDVKHIKDEIELKFQGIIGKCDRDKKGVIPINNSLIGNIYKSILMDGNYCEIEVSINTLSYFKNVLQKIVNLLKWDGKSEICPN